jgi:hypothetical protein
MSLRFDGTCLCCEKLFVFMLMLMQGAFYTSVGWSPVVPFNVDVICQLRLVERIHMIMQWDAQSFSSSRAGLLLLLAMAGL